MSVQITSRPQLRPAVQPGQNPSITFLAEERALLRAVRLRSLTAIEQMYAYWGSDRA